MKLIPILICCCALMALPASAAVYKWVGPDGTVQFSDRPPPTGAETVNVPTAPAPDPNTAGADAAVEGETTLERQQRLLRAYEEERAVKKERAAQQRAEAEQRKHNCMNARDRLDFLKRAGRVTQRGDDGERRVLSTEERAAAEKDAEAAVKQWCG